MAALDLQRLDYFNVGSIGPRCLEILPGSKDSQTQKVVVGDVSGTVQVFGVKKGQVGQVFKAPLGRRVSSVCLGGAEGTTPDKIFVAVGNEIKGYTKKGKSFVSFTTSLSDAIRVCRVKGSSVLVCSEFVYNRYVDLKEAAYYMSADSINDLAVLNTSSHDHRAVLACQDRLLRVLDGSDLMYEVEVPGPPTAVCLWGNDGGPNGDDLVYGTIDGQMGLITLGKTHPDHGWSLPNDLDRGGVTAVTFYHMLDNELPEMLVGRDDGFVEVYMFDDMGEPKLKYSYCAGESITGLRGGQVNSSGYHEVVVSTFKGWVFGLTSELQHMIQQSSDQPLAHAVTEVQASKVAQLEHEINEIQNHVVKEREKYVASSGPGKQGYSTASKFSVNDKFVLSREDASYVLAIEVQMSLDVILLQCDVPMDVVDSEKSSAVMSISQCDPSEGNFFLCTFRCQANTTRFEVKLRTIEGQYGHLNVYITPRTQPKICQVLQYTVKPLSLHQRSHYIDEDKPYNLLKLSGNFSMAEMHAWVKFAIPEVSERPPVDDVATLNFVSIFLDTDLQVKYQKGSAIFRSDNISTIAILKDVLSREATRKKVMLNTSVEVNDESVAHVLKLIHPKLEHQIMLAKKVQLIDALKDLQVQGDKESFLAPEYQDILDNEANIRQEYTRQPAHLERLYGMITDLFIDKFKFKGVNVRNKVDQLTDNLDSYDLNALLNFFQQPQ